MRFTHDTDRHLNVIEFDPRYEEFGREAVLFIAMNKLDGEHLTYAECVLVMAFALIVMARLGFSQNGDPTDREIHEWELTQQAAVGPLLDHFGPLSTAERLVRVATILANSSLGFLAHKHGLSREELAKKLDNDPNNAGDGNGPV